MSAVLLSGHHANVAALRRKQALKLTRAGRPDLFDKLVLSKQDLKLLEEERE